jgi:hypothetical protein
MSDVRRAEQGGISDAWRRVWRSGIVPQLTTEGLRGLLKALEKDSPRLITGATTSPPPLRGFARLAGRRFIRS